MMQKSGEVNLRVNEGEKQALQNNGKAFVEVSTQKNEPKCSFF